MTIPEEVDIIVCGGNSIFRHDFVPYVNHSIQVVRQDVLWQAVLPTSTGTSLFS